MDGYTEIQMAARFPDCVGTIGYRAPVMALCGQGEVMARAKTSKRRQESGDETAVRKRILKAASVAFMKSGYEARPRGKRSRGHWSIPAGGRRGGPGLISFRVAIWHLTRFLALRNQ